jgi:hypothetical protein
VKQFHACSNYAKVIKLPSHSSYICTIPNKNEERMRTAYLLLEIARRLAARWFRSRLYMTAPFCFPFVSMMMKVTACCLGSFFLWFAGGIEETTMLMLVFLGFFVRVFSVFFGSMYFLSLCFVGFLPSVLLCFFLLREVAFAQPL